MADEFGELVKELRTKAGLTQEELRTRCKVPLATLRNWEQGRRRPDLRTAYRLAQALGVSLDALGKVAEAHPLRGTGVRKTQTSRRKKK